MFGTRFNRVDHTALNTDLASADWSPVFQSASVYLKWNNFLDIFMTVIDTHAPLRSVKIRNPSAPVVTDTTRVLMSRRRRALAEFGHGPSQYRAVNRAVRSTLARDTRQNFERRIRDGNKASMWRLILSSLAISDLPVSYPMSRLTT